MILEVKNQSIKSVLKTIEEQAGYRFFYSSDLIDLDKVVSGNFKNKPIEEILASILENTSVGYKIMDNHFVVISPTERLQQTTVTGLVVDVSGEPVIGASVTIKGTNKGVVTDMNGKYSIAISDPDATLVFSYLGYLPQEIAVNGKNIVDVTLKEDTQLLEEVVVVGYGTMRKKDVTGSMSSIATEKIDKSAIKSVDQMLQGRSSGLHMIQSSGMPGASSTVRIRGGNSISGGNEPLYVIDGVPLYPSATSSQTDLSPLNTIAVSDIQSIDVLKDASATAIYGARGANGVIMITTKQGAAGKTKVAFDASVGVQSPRKTYDLLNATEFQDFANEAQWRALGKPANNRYPIYDPDVVPENTDWQGLLLSDNSLMQNYAISVSGGDEKTRFLTTINYMDQEGIVKSTGMEKLTLRANLDRDISSTIKMGLNLSLAQVNSDRAGLGVLGGQNGKQTGFSASAPNIPVFNEDGSYANKNMIGEIFFNPVATVDEVTSFNKRFRSLSNLFVDWQIFKGLTFRTTLGIDLVFGDQQSYLPTTTTEGQGTNGKASVTSSKSYMWVNENTLTYSGQFGKHRLNAMLGLSQQSQKDQSVDAQSQQFLNDNLAMYDLGSGTVAVAPSSGTNEWALLSYFGRINYNFNERYLFTASLRADGSSRFGKSNRWGYFPSAAIAWRAYEEEFIKSLGVFSNLKLRASYGWTGNQDGIGIYPSMALLGKKAYSLNGVKVMGYGPTQVANFNLKWETTHQTDLGLEMGFLNNRLNLSADLYYKTTHDLLLKVTLPSSSGYDSGLKNIGKVENKGIEFGLNVVPVKGTFNWNLDFNISFNKNKVLSLGDVKMMQPNSPSGTGAGLEYSRMLIVGQPLGIFYGYYGDGIFSTTDDIASSAQPTAKPGDIRYKNLNGNKSIDEGDRGVIGCAQPDYFGGMTNTFSYKGFDFSVFMVWSVGNDIYNATKAEMEGMEGNTNQFRSILNRWTEENPNTNIPRAVAVKLSSRAWDYLVEDGSFLRIQNINLGYTVPSGILKSTKVIQSARIYGSLQNFFTFTRYSGLDPEVSRYGQNNIAMGYDHFAYPMAKTVLFGVNLTF
ncbi:SusC/RagA family TonB-linked outer membrane protein [Bacteroidia bacterium]|nr:SusC/RagA family TonB-linked outer membrane protein [Bacteroidia bacterium]